MASPYKTSVTINGKTIPHASYASGTYWTIDGKSTSGSKTFENATGCAGFAKFIRDYIYGSSSAGSTIPAKTLAGTSTDFNGITAGSRINVTYGGQNHSMIVSYIGTAGIDIYDCNWSGTWKVDLRGYTFDAFATKFKKIDSGYTK